MKKWTIVLFCLFYFSINYSQSQIHHGGLKVSTNGHFFEYQDGTPFFWLGDTAWELFHRLTLEEFKTYLDIRKAQGFNVIQAVAIPIIDGLRIPNQYNELPLIDMDPTKLNPAFFGVIDSVVVWTKNRNMILALLPTWGDKLTMEYGGDGPIIFNKENAYQYGMLLGNRYKSYDNLVWSSVVIIRRIMIKMIGDLYGVR